MVQLAKKRCLRGSPDLDRKRRNFDGGGRPAGDRRRLWELLNLENAGKIGLIPPALARKASPIGNWALLGAAMVLLNQEFYRAFFTAGPASGNSGFSGKLYFPGTLSGGNAVLILCPLNGKLSELGFPQKGIPVQSSLPSAADRRKPWRA